jgi:hypothetical protein
MFRAFELVAKFLALVLLTALPAGCALLPMGGGTAILVMLFAMALALAGFALAAPVLLPLKLAGLLTKARFVGIAICAGAVVGSILGYGDLDSQSDPTAPILFHPKLAVVSAFIGMGFGGWSAILSLWLFRAPKRSVNAKTKLGADKPAG